jgi:hypothetical protein
MLVMNQNTKRETGRKVQLANVAAAKVREGGRSLSIQTSVLRRGSLGWSPSGGALGWMR